MDKNIARGLGGVVLLFVSVVARAGFFSDQDRGTRGPTILTMESGVRALGLAGAYVGVSDEVGTLQWNPAGLQQLSRSEVQLMQANLLEGQTQQFVGVGRPVWRRGERETWGFSASLLSMDSFDAVEEGQTTGQAKPQESMVGLTYSRSLFGLSGGLTGKLVQVKTFDQSGQAYAMDLGVRSEGDGPWSWGAAMSNLGTSLKLGQERVGLPLVIRGGIARSWKGPREGKIVTSVQIDAPVDDRLGGRAGVEYAGSSGGNWRWAARAGGRTNAEEPLSLGGGVGLRSMEINYAFLPQSDWGDVHRFDLTWRFGKELAPEVRRRTLIKKGRALIEAGHLMEARPILDELETLSPRNREVRRLAQESQRRFTESLDPAAIFLLARKAFDDGNLSKAADLFRKVLLVDPSHEQARSWLNKIEKKIEGDRTARLKAEVEQMRQLELKNKMRQAAIEAEALRREFQKGMREMAKRTEALRQGKSKISAQAAQSVYKRGMEAYISGELGKAKSLFLEGQALNPEDKNIRQALEHVEAELQLHPGKGKSN